MKDLGLMADWARHLCRVATGQSIRQGLQPRDERKGPFLLLGNVEGVAAVEEDMERRLGRRPPSTRLKKVDTALAIAAKTIGQTAHATEEIC